MELFLFAVIIWVANRIFIIIHNAISLKTWPEWTLKKSLSTALPLALIVAIELISPSMKSTGYIPPPKPVELEWYTQKSAWTTVPLTWADVNHHLFGTALDGYIPKEMLQAQLEKHRLDAINNYEVILVGRRLSAKYSASPGSTSDYYDRKENRARLHMDALNITIENLDVLYANGPFTPLEFRIWQAKIVEDMATIEHARTEILLETAIHNWVVWILKGRKHERIERVLAREKLQAKRVVQASLKDLNLVRTYRAALAHRVEFARPSQSFSTPPWPLEVAAAKNNEPTVNLRTQTLKGPETTSGLLEWGAHIFKAFDNDTRMPAYAPSGIRCYVSITGQTGALHKSETCEIHTPILVNFDLTIADCSSSEDVSCVERWIFPDLTIFLHGNSITFLPPQPTVPAMRPASRWEVTVNGETKPLEEATTFNLAADQLYRLPDYALRQMPNNTEDEIRIWKDFETASFLRNEASLRNDVDFHVPHTFAGHLAETSDLSDKIAHILYRFGQTGKVLDYGSYVAYLSLLNVLPLKPRFGSSNCFGNIENRFSYVRAVSSRLSHLAPIVKSWITKPTPPLENCGRINTLTVLYDNLGPTNPLFVFAD